MKRRFRKLWRGRCGLPSIALLALSVACMVCAGLALRGGGTRAARAAGAPGPTLPQFVTRESVLAVDKGLKYLANTQRADGSWLNSGGYGSYPSTMTSLAGLALLAGGSTPEEGPYAQNVKRAMLYVIRLAQSDNDGLIAPAGEDRSMYGHGFSMLFLAECYGMESSTKYEKQLREVLDKAVTLTAKAQSKRGGWIYTPSGYDPDNADEGSVTVTQLQALRACRNVGIKVPKAVIDKAAKYLKDCQNADGGISYSYKTRGSSRPAISAAAIACFYAAGIYDRQAGGAGEEAATVEKLIRYCRSSIKGVDDHDAYLFYSHFYMAQAMYQHGGKDYEDYFPKVRDSLLSKQAADGSWMGDMVGTTYGTALATIILQLPYGYLPIYQR